MEPRGPHQPLLLTKDSLAAFLTDLGDLSALARASRVYSSDAEDSATSEPPRAKRSKTRSINEDKAVVTRNTKAEHDGRVNALNQEIRELYQELQRLHLIDLGPPSSASAKYKRIAATERFARTRAEYENESLRQHVAEGVAFQEQVKKLLLRQLEMHSRRFTRVEFALIDDDARAFGVLKENLLAKQLQIESSMQSRLSDITRRSMLPRHAQAKNNWGVAVTSQVMRMHVEELDVLPFNAAMMNAAIFQYTQSGTISVDGDKVVDKVVRDVTTNLELLRAALERVSGGRELECRSISRRIQNEHGMVLVWESMAYWQRSDASDDKPRAIVHESGWSVTFPSPQDPEHMSLAHCCKSFRIESLNGPRMKRNDPLLRKMVHTYQELHNLHARSVESIVIDSSLQQNDDEPL